MNTSSKWTSKTGTSTYFTSSSFTQCRLPHSSLCRTPVSVSACEQCQSPQHLKTCGHVIRQAGCTANSTSKKKYKMYLHPFTAEITHSNILKRNRTAALPLYRLINALLNLCKFSKYIVCPYTPITSVKCVSTYWYTGFIYVYLLI